VNKTLLAALDEDAALDLLHRIRRARTKYVGQYRRQASAAVAERGGRGSARPRNRRAALRAEAFEQALSRVSRRLSQLAAQSATTLRGERLAESRAGRGSGPGTASSPSSTRRGVTDRPRGDRDLRSPTRQRERAATRAAEARRQAARDAR
jgi:hypothetical protein